MSQLALIRNRGDKVTSRWMNEVNAALGNGFPASPATYTIALDGTLYKARNGVDGTIVSSNVSPSVVAQAAIADSSDGCLIHMLRGTHTFTDTVTATDKHVIIQGDGPATVIVPPNHKYAFLFTSVPTGFGYPGGVRDLRIDGSAGTHTQGIKFDEVNHGFVSNVISSVAGEAGIGGIHIGDCYNIHVERCRSVSTLGSAYMMQHPSGTMTADHMFDNCTAHDSVNGFYFDEGSAFQAVNCIALSCSNAGFYTQAAYSNGWFLQCIADQMTGSGNGFEITDAATHKAASIFLVNCQGNSSNYGLWIHGDTEPGENKGSVREITVTNSQFNVNRKCGLRIEGYVHYAGFTNCMFTHNNTDNVATEDKTNIMIKNGPQFLEMNHCQTTWLVNGITPPVDRGRIMRIWMDDSALRNMNVRIKDMLMKDEGTGANGIISLKNTDDTYAITFDFSDLKAADSGDTATKGFEIDGGSTGTLDIHDYGAWMSPWTANLPTATVWREGQMLYKRIGGGTTSKLYCCMKTAADTYEWKQVVASS